MVFFEFIGSLIVCGAVLSLINVPDGAVNASVNYPDYHYVPYAGDAFGA